MDRTATVAHTPSDKKNANRLRVPEFGVKKLVVKAGGKESKSYQPEGAANAPDENTGTDEVHFAPEKESVELLYEIVDSFGAITGARLELFCRYKKDPLWTLDLKKLGATWWAPGKHKVKWDGRVVTAQNEQAGKVTNEVFEHDLTTLAVETSLKPFPDGYVNLEHTTYKLKLTVSGDKLTGNPSTAWTYFHILVDKLELEYGPETVLPASVPGNADHRKVLKGLINQSAKPPDASAGKLVKVFLESNIYKRDNHAGDDLEMFDNTLYTLYETLWEDGPQIPLFAKVTIQDSSGTGVDAPKALGNVKFLWDWDSKSATAATGRHGDTFVNDAQDYDQSKTRPKGQNCHVDRGGKRGTGAKPVFPDRAGYAPKDNLDNAVFPFKVEAVKDKRKWAAYSLAWRDKKLAGKTGVIFQPPRMAGDSYSVSVYLAWDVDENDKNKLDVEDDAPLKVPAPKKVMASTGVFQIWRKTHLRKHLRKRAAGMPALNLATIRGSYQDAFMDLENVSGGVQDMQAVDWNSGITNAITGWGDFEKLTIDPSVDQHAAGPKGVFFRDRATFIEEWKKKTIYDNLVAATVPNAHATTISNAAGIAATAAAARVAAQTQAQILGYNVATQTTIGNRASNAWTAVDTAVAVPTNRVDTNSNYADLLEDLAFEVLETLFDDQFDPGDGVTIFQTEHAHNQTHLQASGFTIGLAHNFGKASRSQCGFLLMSKVGDTACGIDKISAHEIGHHYFLPHPTDTAEKQDYKAHDKLTPSKCLMSYNFALPMDLCGFCQLRLRGWDKSKLDPDGPKNKKT